MWTMLRKMPTGSGLPDGPSEPVTRTRVRADAKKAAFAYRMPLIQNSGLLDGTWPAAQDDPFKRLASFDYWKTYNNIPLTPYEPAAACESGLTADEMTVRTGASFTTVGSAAMKESPRCLKLCSQSVCPTRWTCASWSLPGSL